MLKATLNKAFFELFRLPLHIFHRQTSFFQRIQAKTRRVKTPIKFLFLLELQNSNKFNITIQNPIIQIIKMTRPMRTEMPYNQNGTAFSSLITIFEQATVLTLFSLSNGLSSCIPSLRIIFACDFMSTFSQSAKSLKIIIVSLNKPNENPYKNCTRSCYIVLFYLD